ncbi:MAG: hypothetical protein ACD_41C00116G0002 [uncultured bacterium]|nr:MAG: hypothetical protein ACD_41C00116G0002 [uncultured bacterium]
MKKKTSTQSLYVIFGVVIALLIALIGYFAYLLVSPGASDPAVDVNETVTVNTNTEKSKKKKTNANSDAASNVNTNTNTESASGGNATTNTNETEDEAGLVEPPPEEDATETEADAETTEAVVAGEGEQLVTLYFPKASSSCGEVFPVKRAVTPEEDLYGQILLATIAGPITAEVEYVSVVPSGLRLRRVEYTAAGPTIYVNEAFSAARDCDQQTVEAQLVETANAMFDFPTGTAGEVVVGYPEELQP